VTSFISTDFFSGFRAFVPVLFYIAFPYHTVFLFSFFSSLPLCICTVFVFYLRLCAGFITDNCAVKPAY
jgi:hypothetical protein